MPTQFDFASQLLKDIGAAARGVFDQAAQGGWDAPTAENALRQQLSDVMRRYGLTDDEISQFWVKTAQESQNLGMGDAPQFIGDLARYVLERAKVGGTRALNPEIVDLFSRQAETGFMAEQIRQFRDYLERGGHALMNRGGRDNPAMGLAEAIGRAFGRASSVPVLVGGFLENLAFDPGQFSPGWEDRFREVFGQPFMRGTFASYLAQLFQRSTLADFNRAMAARLNEVLRNVAPGSTGDPFRSWMDQVWAAIPWRWASYQRLRMQ